MNLVPRNQIFDFDSLFNDVFHGFGRPALRSGNSDSLAGMRVDVHETDSGYEIHADLPGVKKEDIEIVLQNDVLTISASKKTQSEEKENDKVIWRERSSGSISRSFSVSPGTTQDDIKANFADGVLTLSVPGVNAEKAAPKSNRIPVE